VQPNVGHYGVFNGSRFTAEIAPRVQAFIQDQEANRGAGNLTGLAPSSRRLVREYATLR
jgi:poly(3-hydroxybutyrate) depolymerase